MNGSRAYFISAAAIFIGIVMILVACAPMTTAQDPGMHIIVKGEKGPRESAVTWQLMTGSRPAIWSGWIENNGLRSLIIEISDVTTGVADEISSQRIRFAAYPSVIVMTGNVLFRPNSIYEITAIPNGAKGSSAAITDNILIIPPPIPLFTYAVDGLTVTVDATPSSSDHLIISYDWDWGDGSFGSGIITSHTYGGTGDYEITMTIMDDMGLTWSYSQTVHVEKPLYPPKASFVATISYQTIMVDASGSTDSDGTIVSYDWAWGDGSTGTGMITLHTYAAPGAYVITLRVTDNDGLIDTVEKYIGPPPPNVPPVALFALTASQMTVAVDASASFDPDGVIVYYGWNWGDDSTDTGITASHTYASSGTYTVTLTVIDDRGASNSDSLEIYLWGPLLPIATFTYSIVDLTVSVDASASIDPDGTIVLYDWNWGDGATGSGVLASHSYSAEGTYVVTLTIIDNSGLAASCSNSIDVFR